MHLLLNNSVGQLPSTSTSASPERLLRPLPKAEYAIRELPQDTTLSTSPNWCFIEAVSHGTRRFTLHQPLTIKIQQFQDRTWEAASSKLGIIAVGKTATVALGELQEEFAIIWDALAFEDDDQLSADGRELKATLRKLVKLQ